MKTATRLFLMLSLALTFGMSLPAVAQDGGQGGDRGGDRGRPDWENMSEEEREAFRKRMEERRAEFEKQQSDEMRKQLEMTEEDFAVVGPLIEKVRNATRERDSASRGGRGFGGPGGQGAFTQRGGAEQSEHVKAANEAVAELRQAIEDDNAGDIKNALAKLRKARVALDKAVKDAREELRSVSTAKWEAEFVLMGLLD